MAKLTFSAAIPELLDWTDLTHFGKKFSMDGHQDNTATFTSGDNDFMSIQITGTGLTYNQSGNLVGGTVNKIVYDFGGDAYLTIKDVSLDAVTVRNAFEFAGIWAADPAAAGKDIVNGSADHDNIFGMDGKDRLDAKAGNDIVDGGDGSDRMTGGRGSDTFVFRSNESGRDVITDFDAVGGTGHQDFLRISGEYNVAKSGKDTIITYADGDEIVLIGVKPNQIDASDLVM
jgi:Ca2+-binding RTX toxin-like protein